MKNEELDEFICDFKERYVIEDESDKMLREVTQEVNDSLTEERESQFNNSTRHRIFFGGRPSKTTEKLASRKQLQSSNTERGYDTEERYEKPLSKSNSTLTLTQFPLFQGKESHTCKSKYCTGRKFKRNKISQFDKYLSQSLDKDINSKVDIKRIMSQTNEKLLDVLTLEDIFMLEQGQNEWENKESNVNANWQRDLENFFIRYRSQAKNRLINVIYLYIYIYRTECHLHGTPFA